MQGLNEITLRLPIESQEALRSADAVLRRAEQGHGIEADAMHEMVDLFTQAAYHCPDPATQQQVLAAARKQLTALTHALVPETVHRALAKLEHVHWRKDAREIVHAMHLGDVPVIVAARLATQLSTYLEQMHQGEFDPSSAAAAHGAMRHARAQQRRVLCERALSDLTGAMRRALIADHAGEDVERLVQVLRTRLEHGFAKDEAWGTMRTDVRQLCANATKEAQAQIDVAFDEAIAGIDQTLTATNEKYIAALHAAHLQLPAVAADALQAHFQGRVALQDEIRRFVTERQTRAIDRLVLTWTDEPTPPGTSEESLLADLQRRVVLEVNNLIDRGVAAVTRKFPAELVHTTDLRQARREAADAAQKQVDGLLVRSGIAEFKAVRALPLAPAPVAIPSAPPAARHSPQRIKVLVGMLNSQTKLLDMMLRRATREECQWVCERIEAGHIEATPEAYAKLLTRLRDA